MTSDRLLVVFVDALGPQQLERFAERLEFLPHRRALGGVLGYTSGALPTVLTGVEPAVHGRMCLFSEHKRGSPHLLAPLRWLGLLPRVLHERRRLRALAERLLKMRHGLSGYVALHKVPPEHFQWLDLPERDDLFSADDIGGARTFLADARDAGLSVYVSPWQQREQERWASALDAVQRQRPHLAFLYCSELDAILHREGSRGPDAEAALDRIAQNLRSARERMLDGGGNVTTLVVGDHGMADITRPIDPRKTLARVRVRHFVDATMVRFWGTEHELRVTRRALKASGWPGRWLDLEALRASHAPTRNAPFGNAFFVLDEGAMFAPSFLGGACAGMHGYGLGSPSCFAGLASDRPLPERCQALSNLAGHVRVALGLSATGQASASGAPASRSH